ncbi:MAG: ADP-ribosylation factor-like protein [Candidatus Njordarchaeum guaymaensis]
MSLKYAKEILKRNIRVAIIGLNGVGKTSFGFLLEKLDKEKALNTHPSTRIEKFQKRYLNKRALLFVFPGQKRYFKRLERFISPFIRSIDILIYMIDSSDFQRFKHMQAIFLTILQLIKKLNLEIKVILLAHKQDIPGAKTPREIEKIFWEPFKKTFSNIQVEIYGTSIYDVRSIFRVLREGILNRNPTDRTYNSILVELQKELNCEELILSDSEGLLIDSIKSSNPETYSILVAKIFKYLEDHNIESTTWNETIETFGYLIIKEGNTKIIIINKTIEESYRIFLIIKNPTKRADLNEILAYYFSKILYIYHKRFGEIP